MRSGLPVYWYFVFCSSSSVPVFPPQSGLLQIPLLGASVYLVPLVCFCGSVWRDLSKRCTHAPCVIHTSSTSIYLEYLRAFATARTRSVSSTNSRSRAGADSTRSIAIQNPYVSSASTGSIRSIRSIRSIDSFQ